ncbi:MAG: hypothetical protein AAGG07_10260 [Planctomycetota bacterium]
MISVAPLLGQIRTEWLLQRRRPFVWFCLATYLVLAIGDTVQAGWTAEGGLKINGADMLSTRAIIYSLLGVIAAAGIVSEPFVRDRASGAAGLVLTTGAGRAELSLARFIVAAGLAVAAGLMFVPGVILGTMAPGIPRDFIAPLNAGHYLGAATSFIVPNFLLMSALAFAVSSRTQSQAAAYASAVTLLSLWIIVRMVLGQDVLRHDIFAIASILDPFGSIASAEFAMSQTVAQNNERFPPLAGLLLWNRVVWGVITLLLVCAGVAGFPMRERLARGSPRTLDRARRQTGLPRSILPNGPLFTMTAWELRCIVRTPGVKLVLVLVALSLWWSAASAVTHRFSLPSTDLLVHNTGFYFDKILLLAVVWVAGDLVWRERARKVDPLIDTLPTLDWQRFVSKLLALIVVVAVFWSISIVVGVLYQTYKGYHDYELGLYLIDTFVIKAPYYVFLAVLALAAQVLIGRRYIAMCAVLAVYLSEVLLDALGLYHPIYRYGRTSFFWYSLMDGYGHFLRAHLWLLLYWGLCASAIAVLGAMGFSRGEERIPGYRLLRRQASVTSLGLVSCLFMAFAAVGGFVWYQSTVRATWPPIHDDRMKAAVELAYGDDWRATPQPRVVEIAARLDLYPSERRFDMSGRLDLYNPHSAPIEELLVMAEPWLDVTSIRIPGGHELARDDSLNTRVIRLDPPLEPGEETTLEFTTSWAPPRGFSVHAENDGIPQVAPTEVLGNGTSLLNLQIMPAIGYTDRVEHKPGWKRQKYGLNREWVPPDPQLGIGQAHATLHLDWVRRVDMEITTDPDQTIVHPGVLRESWISDDNRRGFRFVIDRPSRGWATLVSARLEETRFARAGLPDVVLFHDPEHTHTLEELGRALQDAIEHFQDRYGPPPFDEFRMAEQSLHFDGMGARSGMGFASEVLGWKTDVSVSGGEDLHEMAAHLMGMTWFGDQLIPANVAGAKVVHAGLPFWSAQLYLHQRRDADLDRRLRLQKLSEAFRGRGSLIDEEVPFAEEFKDSTMLRAKGAGQILYLASLMGGADQMERVFAEFLEAWRYRPAPFPVAEDLIGAIRSALPSDSRDQVEHVFNDVTTYALETTDAIATPTSDGRWRVSASFRVEQLRTTGWGQMEPVPFDAKVEVVALADRGFGADSVIRRERLAPTSGSVSVEWILDRRPARICIDPMLMLPDPNPRDNIRSVQIRAPDAG